MEKISTKNQNVFLSGVRTLLYLIKHLRPNIVNWTQELSKVNDNVSPAVFHELLQMIKYVLDTNSFGLKLEP